MADINDTHAPTRRWVAGLVSQFPGIEVRDVHSADFYGEVRRVDLGELTMSCISSVPQRILGTGQGADVVKLLIQVAGRTAVTHRGQTGELDVGMFALIDGRYPFTLEITEAYRQLLVCVPRNVLATHLPETVPHKLIGGENPGEALLRDYVVALSKVAGSLDRAGQLRAATALLELLSAARGGSSSDAGTALVSQAVAIIERDLAMSDLTPDRLAADLRISRRYLDMLFAASGMSASRRIWGRRLEQAAERLARRMTPVQSISEIAYEAGFQDPSHFTRAFRRRFGVTPRAWRERKRAMNRTASKE